MEIKMNREIREYTESIFLGLSLRQFVFSLAAVLTAVLLYFMLRNRIPTEAVSWVCVIGAMPFGFLGFFRYHGMNAEQTIIAVVKSEILMPKILTFQSEPFYYSITRRKTNENIKTALKRRKTALPHSEVHTGSHSD
ncbi:MAG: PrgI family protein [Anaerofustis sp.]